MAPHDASSDVRGIVAPACTLPEIDLLAGRASGSVAKDIRESGSMHPRLWTTIALLAFVYTLLPSLPAAAGYGAIAWDRQSGKAGWVWNQPTAKRAAEMAISQCGASGCRLVIKPTSGCAALASTESGKYIGAAARKTKDEARLAALADCKKGNAGECIVRASECNGAAPGEIK